VERLSAAERAEPGRPGSAGAGASDAVPVNRVREAGEWLEPVGADLTLDADSLAVTIPTGFTEMQQADLALARAWRASTREIFTTYLSRGYEVVDFVLERRERRGTYVLSKRGPSSREV
jgi:predicted GNAT superfamily acetyltransferase